MARALHRDAQAARARVVHERLHVGGALGQRDERGTLIDGEVPGLAGGVPALVGGEHDGAGQTVAERRDVGDERGGGEHPAMLPAPPPRDIRDISPVGAMAPPVFVVRDPAPTLARRPRVASGRAEDP